MTKNPSITQLQINIVDQCTLRCVLCAHSAPWLQKKFLSLSEFVSDLKALTEHVHIGRLRLLGGEPLLHPHWIDMLKVSRKNKFADQVGISTNGTLLHRFLPEALRYLDFIEYSRYPGVNPKMPLAEVTRQCKEHGVELYAPKADHFQVLALNDQIRDEEVVKKIYSTCNWIGGVWMLRDGYFHTCAVSGLLKDRMAVLGKSVENSERDGVFVRSNPRLREDIEKHLARTEPLLACSYCLGSSGGWVKHRQLSAKEILLEKQLDSSEFTKDLRKKLKVGS